MEVQEDLLGLRRGACQNCVACPGFRRWVPLDGTSGAILGLDSGASAPFLFRCDACGCFSKDHKQQPLQPLPSRSQAPPSTEAAMASSPVTQTPPVVTDFEREENFKDLVFQPAALRALIPCLKARKCRICVLGGSISLQQRGYRPNLAEALRRRGVAVEDLPAAVGTAGCRPLSLVVNDLVLTKQPDLLIIEVAVNDGDDLLESTPCGASALSIRRAAEGIVRTARRRCPQTAILFLEMFLRDDAEARKLKTGCEAWRNTEEAEAQEAISWYHHVAPRLHREICERYGLTQIDLVPALRSLSVQERQKWFRDDCHHSDFGGEAVGNLLARLILWAVRQPETPGNAPKDRGDRGDRLGPPMDPDCWCNGKTIRILPGWTSTGHSLRRDKDLLRLGQQTDWFLLYAGGHATIPFKGRACGLMTLLGPDAPSLKVQVDGGPLQRVPLLDRWCYYWRDAVVLLCDGLSDTTHTLYLEVEMEASDHRCLKRPASSELWLQFLQEARAAGRPPQKLWLSYACAVESDAVFLGDVVGVRRRHGDWLELVQDCEVRFKKRESPEQPITAVNPLRRHKDGRQSKSSGAQTAWMMVEHPELGQLMRRARKRKGGLGSGCVLSPDRRQMYQEVVELCHRRIYKENLESLWDGEAEKLPTLETIEAKLFDEEMKVLHVTQDGKFTGGALVKELSVKARHVEGSSNLNLAAPAHHHPGTSTEILGTTTVGYIDSMASEEKTQSGRVMWDFMTGMPFICLACHSILRQKTVDFWQARGMRHMDPSNEKDCTAFRQLVMVHTMGKVICELKDLQEALPKSKLPLFVWVPSRFTEEDENLHDNYIFKPDEEMIELIS